MTNNLDRAHDFTQDIFLKVFTKLDSFQGRARFSTWLFSLTSNYCIDQLRAAKRSLWVEIEGQVEHPLVEAEQDTLPEERLQLVYKAMTKLTPSEQHFIRLKYEHNLTSSDIAQLHGLHPGTLKMQMHRSKTKIQRRVGSNRLRSE
ncbi:hypothetical protein BH09BAC4_BH09BAC4_23580 [soil metagenome]